MKQSIICKTLAVSVILLFLGLAIQPSVAVEPEKQKDILGLGAQIRTVVNEILQNYGYIPMINTICICLIGALNTIGLNILCIISGLVFILPLLGLIAILFNAGITDAPLGKHIFHAMCTIFAIWYYSCSNEKKYSSMTFPSFEPLTNLIKTNDITNIIEDCPCLRE
jgi:hypothetical protein